MNSLEIKQKRKQKGLTQDEFAKLIGVSKRTVVNYEKGEVIPATKISIIKQVLSMSSQDVEQPKELTFDELVKQKVKEIVDPIMEEQEKKNKIFTDSIERMFKILVDLQNKSTGSNSSSLTS